MPTTVILRFRDLATASGETVRRHQEIIQSHGYVWWGWWWLPQERIPRDAFAHFTTMIQTAGGITVFLLDSGARNAYEARVSGIHVAPTEKAVATPEAPRTPGYYAERPCKAWFRMTGITQCDSDRLRGLSYDEVTGFLDDPTSSAFQHKRVFGIDELLRRLHRTMYFVKQFDARSDKDHEIFLAAARQPSVFNATPRFRPSKYFLHLSDLHFSERHHRYPARDSPGDRSLGSLLVDDLNQLNKGPPAAVLLSGDLTWQGGAEEFRQVLELLGLLRSRFELDPYYDFVIVPGNHDIQWARQEADGYEKSNQVEFPEAEAQANYAQFFASAFGISANRFLSMGRRYVLSNYVSVDILGLNSCRLEQRHFAGYGYVGLDQLNDGAQLLGWLSGGDRTRYRMLVMHHHLIPVAPVEQVSTYDNRYSLTLDAGQIVHRAMELDVDLVSHGHMHQPFVACVSRRIGQSSDSRVRSTAVHCAGSVGVERTFLGPIGKNAYSIYEFDQRGVSIHIRSTSENLQGFEEESQFRLIRAGENGLAIDRTA